MRRIGEMLVGNLILLGWIDILANYALRAVV